MELRLIEYKDVLEFEYIDYIQEWESTKETIVPSATKRNRMSYIELMDKWTLDETDKKYELGFVPSTLYFLVNNQDRIFRTKKRCNSSQT
jgi:predicted acetyltransferase